MTEYMYGYVDKIMGGRMGGVDDSCEDMGRGRGYLGRWEGRQQVSGGYIDR